MAPTEDTKRKYERLADNAIDYGKRMCGAPYGAGWREGSWPALSPLYSHITRHDAPAWYRSREVICAGLVNVLRYEIADLPSVGWGEDQFPGGTAAIGRHLAYEEDGTRRYGHVKSTPRGWLVFAPYRGSALSKQGHVGVALGNTRLLEARVPHLSDNRIEEEVSDGMVMWGGAPFVRIIAPWIWLRK